MKNGNYIDFRSRIYALSHAERVSEWGAGDDTHVITIGIV
jgi:hypothetical protein